MHSVFALLKSTALFLGLDQTRCVACFAPYSPTADVSFQEMYEKVLPLPEEIKTTPPDPTEVRSCSDFSGFSPFQLQWNKSPQLCPDCLQKLAPRTKGYCPICGKLYALENGLPSRCSDCLISPPPWTHLSFYGAYEGTLRELLLQYKFHGRLDTGLTLARLLAASYSVSKTPPVAVIPVPLHSTRLLERGHNQSLLPAKLLASKLNAKLMPSVLRRTRKTPPQAMLQKKERPKNISGAFAAILPDHMKDQHLLIVDDIATTGATLEQAAKTLLKAGAGSIEVALLARTPEPEDTFPAL